VADRAKVIEDLMGEAIELSVKELVSRVKDGTASHQDFNVIRQWAKDNDVTINTMSKNNPFADLPPIDVPEVTEDDITSQ